MKLLKTIKITSIVLALCAVSILPVGCGSNTAATATTQTATVTRGNLVTQITSVGNLDFSETVTINSKIDCTVSQVLVAAGDSVKKGQVLFSFDSTEWQNEISTLTDATTTALHNLTAKKRGVTQAQQALLNAQLGVQTANNTVLTKQVAYLQAQITLQNAVIALTNAEQTTTDQLQLQLKQLQVLVAQNQVDIAKIDYDNAVSFAVQNAQTVVDDAVVTLEDAQAAVGYAQTALDEANKTLTDAQASGSDVKAPQDGIITTVSIIDDQIVVKGAPMVTIADPTKFKVSVMVSELNILKIKVGGPATVQVEVVSGITLPATVKLIAPSATISSGVVNYQVQVELSPISANLTALSNIVRSGNMSGSRPSGQSFSSGNLTQAQIDQFRQQRQSTTSTSGQTSLTTGVKLAQGMTVTVNIITAQANNALLVPTGAIVSQGTKTTVQVLVNGVAETREVQTGISNSSYTVITSGLNEGEVVVVNQTSSSSSSSSSSSPGAQQRQGGGLFFGG